MEIRKAQSDTDRDRETRVWGRGGQAHLQRWHELCVHSKRDSLMLHPHYVAVHVKINQPVPHKQRQKVERQQREKEGRSE